MKDKRKIIIIAVSVLITAICVSAVIYASRNYKKSISSDQDGLLVVASVNGVLIYQKSLNLAMSQIVKNINLAQIDTTKDSVREDIMVEALNSVISKELLVQNAKSKGIKVSDNDITLEINNIIYEQGGYDKYIENLKSLNISEKDFRSDVEKQLYIDFYEKDVFSKTNETISETEIQVFYENLRNKYIAEGSIAPDLELVRSKIVEKIKESKHEIFLDEEAKRLKKDAKIDILI